MAVARDFVRHQRQAEAAQRRALREAESDAKAAQREMLRLQREHTRSLKESEREEKARHIQAQEQLAVEQSAEITCCLDALSELLAQTLSVDDTIAFASLRIIEPAPILEVPSALLQEIAPPMESRFLGSIPEWRWWRALIPGAKDKHHRALASAQAEYVKATNTWQQAEEERKKSIKRVEEENSATIAAFERKKADRNSEVDEFEANYRAGDPDAIVAYYSMTLERSVYPDGFPQNFSVAYTVESKQLVVKYELPTVSVVPEMESHRYVRSTDTISSKPRKTADTKKIYEEVISSIALRTIHEIFEADQTGHIQAVCFNGFINTVDPATGQDIQPHLISVRTTAERFLEIDLSRIDKRVCLKNLGAQVSRRPDEAQPIKPIVEFEMADARFIDQADLVSGLSSATNLMDFTPQEFEHLVANLFEKMGLESKLTRSSRDGGVDCVAFDARPVLGGKVVIQAKRYRNTVGVSAVRDLFGTMMNEGANKGILVTTSGYGPDAFDFAKDKPIELIDGGGLLYLLQQEAGMHARIVFPDEH